MFDTIIVPQGAEYQAVIRGLKQAQIGNISVIAIPIGTTQINTILERANFWQNQPKKVLMTGLCGSLTSEYSVGDIALYQECCSQKKQQFLTLSTDLNQLINQKITSNLVKGITSDRIITKVSKKQQLARKISAQVVDMESFAYLELLQSHNINVSILRIVSDDLKFDLPNLNQTINSAGKIKPFAMATAMSQKPIASLNFIKNSLQSLNKLQQVMSILF